MFFDHNVFFDNFDVEVNYFIIKIQLETTADEIQKLLNEIKTCGALNYELIFFTDNKNLHYNLRTDTDNIKIIHELIVANGFNFNFFEQLNRYCIVSLRQARNKIEVKPSIQHDIIEEPKLEIPDDRLKIMQILILDFF